jgi:hypothetical protein
MSTGNDQVTHGERFLSDAEPSFLKASGEGFDQSNTPFSLKQYK